MTKNAKVLIQWNGETPILARLVAGGSKVLFDTGDCFYADFQKAYALTSMYKRFVIVEPHLIEPKKLAKAIDYEKGIVESKEQRAEDLAKDIEAHQKTDEVKTEPVAVPENDEPTDEELESAGGEEPKTKRGRPRK